MALRQIGEERYHSRHPFQIKLQNGELSKEQVQAWALNRYYYQASIPVKDAYILARLTRRSCAANGASGSSTTTGRKANAAASRSGSR